MHTRIHLKLQEQTYLEQVKCSVDCCMALIILSEIALVLRYGLWLTLVSLAVLIPLLLILRLCYLLMIKLFAAQFYRLKSWYEFRKTQCHCQAPAQYNAAWEGQLRKFYPQPKRPRTQKNKQLCSLFLGYWVVLPWLLTVMVVNANIVSKRPENVLGALFDVIQIGFMHFVIGLLISLALSRQRIRKLSLHYCKECWILARLYRASYSRTSRRYC